MIAGGALVKFGTGFLSHILTLQGGVPHPPVLCRYGPLEVDKSSVPESGRYGDRPYIHRCHAYG
jgi:hypothetical protein